MHAVTYSPPNIVKQIERAAALGYKLEFPPSTFPDPVRITLTDRLGNAWSFWKAQCDDVLDLLESHAMRNVGRDELDLRARRECAEAAFALPENAAIPKHAVIEVMVQAFKRGYTAAGEP